MPGPRQGARPGPFPTGQDRRTKELEGNICNLRLTAPRDAGVRETG